MRSSYITSLDSAYKHESDVDVKERILLVRRVMSDGKEVATICKEELHRSKAWAYKWLARFKREGLNGLKDKPRSGRPLAVPEEKLLKLRKELSENQSGWRAKEIMDIIYKRTGVRYHEVHVYRLLHKWGFSPKVPRKVHVNAASKQEKDNFQKRPKA